MGSDSNDLLSSQYKAVYTHRRCLPVLLKKTGLCQVLFACNHHKIVFHHHYHINNNQHIYSTSHSARHCAITNINSLNLHLTLYDRYYYPHFTDKKMEA